MLLVTLRGDANIDKKGNLFSDSLYLTPYMVSGDLVKAKESVQNGAVK